MENKLDKVILTKKEFDENYEITKDTTQEITEETPQIKEDTTLEDSVLTETEQELNDEYLKDDLLPEDAIFG